MALRKNDHCRLPQRADIVAGVELVVGLTPIAAVPDNSRKQAILDAPADEIRASRRLQPRSRQVLPK